jgi:hypothetical protein
MNATETQRAQGFTTGAYLSESAGRTAAEAIGAIATVILAVIALAGVLPSLLASIATIVIGAGILVEGWASGSTYRQLSAANATVRQTSVADGALTAEFLGGVAGVVLGILALFGKVPDTLLSVALLVYGATLLLSSFGTTQAAWRSGSFSGQMTTESTVVRPMPTLHSGHLLVGLGAVVLGILAVVGLAPATLILIGLLSLGAAMLLCQFQFP